MEEKEYEVTIREMRFLWTKRIILKISKFLQR